jgi:hypothetical protein
MRDMTPIEPFGQVSIPPLSSGELTANYQASDWNRLSECWQIAMYWTVPGSGRPVEMPSVTHRAHERDFMQVAGQKAWDDVMEEVLRDRAEAWEKLANL